MILNYVGFLNFCIAILECSVILSMRMKFFIIKILNKTENCMFWFLGVSICYSDLICVVISRHLFPGFKLLALMFCGIFLMRAVMLRSLWLTAMVIKIIQYPIIPWKGLAGVYFHVLILFLLPPEMGLCWSVLYPEFSHVLALSLRYFFVNIKGPFS